MATKRGKEVQGVGRVFFIEKGKDDWTHAALLCFGPDVCTVVTEGVPGPRVQVVPTADLMECAPYWCGGCAWIDSAGVEHPTEFLAWQQAIIQARADQNLRHGVDEQGRIREVKTVPAFVGVHGCIHPNLQSDGSFKPL